MKAKWVGLAAVTLLLGGVLVAKQYTTSPAGTTTASTAGAPQVLMLADMREAGGEDGCAKIISAVQDAEQRHIRVAVFSPGDRSPLLTRYRVLVTPTVLLLAPDGRLSARFEGESPEIVTAVQASLAKIRPTD